MPSSIRSAERSYSGEDEKRRHEPDDIFGPEYNEQIRNAAPMLSGRKLTAALAFVAGTGFTLFGWVSASSICALQ